ncbi:MAG: DNA polymerase III subunit gamma/tau [Christensenellales bacterium]
MSHIALYREFRPKTFDDVVGQDHIVKTLQNQIKNGLISHAYLFCGTRGTGKTSCAKIFAKAVNCLNPQNGSPCGECEVCKTISGNGNLDIVEIDAASNNRVDEIRDLKEKVNYLPTVGKYKVYIVDEVHMLTDSAFNALLKTLEEPPKHIIFILATTEPQKLPATILSRCMRFDFKLVSQAELVGLLAKIFDQTGTKYERIALEQIAKAGKGSVRDTLSVAEMCLAYSNGNIIYNSVMQCLGLTDDKTLFELTLAIIEKNGQKILDIIELLYNKGKNISVLISDLCAYFQTLLSVKFGCDISKNVPQDVANNFNKLAQKVDGKYLLDCLKTLCDAENSIKFCVSEKAFAQTTLLSLFYNDNMEIAILKKKIAEIESVLKQDLEKKTLNSANQSQSGFVKNENNFQSKNESLKTNSTLNLKLDEVTHKVESTDDKNIVSQVASQSNINASEIFGKLIKHARENGEMRLFAGMNDVANVFVNNGEFVFECKSQSCVDLIDEHKQFVLNFLQKNGLQNYKAVVEIDDEKQKQEKLMSLFGEKLKII